MHPSAALRTALFCLAPLLMVPSARGLAGTPANLALGKPVTAISNSTAGSPEFVVDGDLQTVWWSYQGGTSVVEFSVDLGEVYPLDAFVQRLMQIEHFELHGSEDGSTWVLLHQQSIGYYDNPTLTAVLPEPVSARHVRLRAWNAQVAFAGVAELEVYGSEKVFANGFEALPNGDCAAGID